MKKINILLVLLVSVLLFSFVEKSNSILLQSQKTNPKFIWVKTKTDDFGNSYRLLLKTSQKENIIKKTDEENLSSDPFLRLSKKEYKDYKIPKEAIDAVTGINNTGGKSGNIIISYYIIQKDKINVYQGLLPDPNFDEVPLQYEKIISVKL